MTGTGVDKQERRSASGDAELKLTPTALKEDLSHSDEVPAPPQQQQKKKKKTSSISMCNKHFSELGACESPVGEKKGSVGNSSNQSSFDRTSGLSVRSFLGTSGSDDHKLIMRLQVLFVILGFCVIAAVSVPWCFMTAQRVEVSIREQQLEDLNAYAATFATSLKEAMVDIYRLGAATEDLAGTMILPPGSSEPGSPDEQWAKNVLEQVLKSMGSTDNRVYQARIIDDQGMERIRVNFDGHSGAEVVPESLLQSKILRDYTNASLALKPESLYISAIDLNVENDIIELPYTPVMRISTGLFAEGGEDRPFGFAILNLWSTEIFRGLHSAVGRDRKYAVASNVLNEGGFWLQTSRSGADSFLYGDSLGFPGSTFEALGGSGSAEAWRDMKATTSTGDCSVWCSSQLKAAGNLYTYISMRFCSLAGYDSNFESSCGSSPQGAVYFVSEVSGTSIQEQRLQSCIWIIVASLCGLILWFMLVCVFAQSFKVLCLVAEKQDLSRKLEQINYLLATVSHEIRTPLNVMMGAVEMLKENGLTPSDQACMVGMMESSNSSMLELVSNVLDSTQMKQGELNPQPCALQSCLVQAISGLMLLASESGIELRTDLSPALPLEVEIDWPRLKQVILNLVSNSIKFTQDGHIDIKINVRRTWWEGMIEGGGSPSSSSVDQHMGGGRSLPLLGRMVHRRRAQQKKRASRLGEGEGDVETGISLTVDGCQVEDPPPPPPPPPPGHTTQIEGDINWPTPQVFTARIARGQQLRCEMELVVSDTGIGISAEQQESIFLPFRQAEMSTKRRFGGVGLGLAISRKIIRMMHGDIQVTSEIGKGSTFTCSFQVRVTAPHGTEPIFEGFPGLRIRRCLVSSKDPVVLKNVDAFCERSGVELVLFPECTDIDENGAEVNKIDQMKLWREAVRDGHICTDDTLVIDGSDFASSEEVESLLNVIFGCCCSPASVILLCPALELYAISVKIRSRICEVFSRVCFVHPPWTPNSFAEELHALLDPLHEPVQKSADVSSGEQLPGGQVHQRVLKVLVVDDQALNQKVLKRMLENLGHKVDTAMDGLVCIDMMKKKRYDVVLMDYHMPRMDGVEASERIVKMWAREERPVIVGVTAAALQAEQDRCLRSGMDRFLTKPIQKKRLVEVLGELANLLPGQEQPS
jgi:signal transduction histidine kinase/CheY-like chemotaxis protein